MKVPHFGSSRVVLLNAGRCFMSTEAPLWWHISCVQAAVTWMMRSILLRKFWLPSSFFSVTISDVWRLLAYRRGIRTLRLRGQHGWLAQVPRNSARQRRSFVGSLQGWRGGSRDNVPRRHGAQWLFDVRGPYLCDEIAKILSKLLLCHGPKRRVPRRPLRWFKGQLWQPKVGYECDCQRLAVTEKATGSRAGGCCSILSLSKGHIPTHLSNESIWCISS